jgi:MFS family permease
LSADPAPTQAGAATYVVSSVRAWYALLVLGVVTLFALVDRQILVLLSEPIRKQLGLSDLQLGLLQGTAVTLFAALAAYPLSWLADRVDRRWVMAGCVLAWSLACAACGLAQDYTQLLLASALVGAAEAGLVPITYALIPSLFAPARRQLANSSFAMATGIGGGATIALCGLLVTHVDSLRPWLPEALKGLEGWRLSFLVAALPGPFMAVWVLSIAGGNAVTRTAAPVAALARAAAAPLLPYLREHRRTFVHFCSGVGLSFFGFGAVSGWMANMLMRQFAQTPQQVGNGMGLAGSTGLVLGFLITAFGLRQLAARLGDRLPLRALWIATLCTALCNFALMRAPSALSVYVIYGVMIMCLTLAGMLYITALQGLAPNTLRARVVSVQTIINSLAGAAAVPLVGLLSDQLKDRPNGLMIAATAVATPALLLSAWLLHRGETPYAQTAQANARADAADAARALA